MTHIQGCLIMYRYWFKVPPLSSHASSYLCLVLLHSTGFLQIVLLLVEGCLAMFHINRMFRMCHASLLPNQATSSRITSLYPGQELQVLSHCWKGGHKKATYLS